MKRKPMEREPATLWKRHEDPPYACRVVRYGPATAHDEFALRAFEVHALDYLLKPFSQERFREAVRRAMAYIRRQRDAAQDSGDARLQALLNDIRNIR